MQYLGSIRGDDEYLKYLQKLSKYRLLILDDFGVTPLKANESRDLLEIIEDRVNSSTIITSQLAIKDAADHLGCSEYQRYNFLKAIHNCMLLSCLE